MGHAVGPRCVRLLDNNLFSAFASALESVPMALAENSGLNPVETLTDLRSDQKTSGNPRLGVDALYTGDRDMKVIRTLF